MTVTPPDGTALVPSNQEGMWSSQILPFTMPQDGDVLSLVAALSSKIDARRFDLQLIDSYYRGEQAIGDLGIAIPPKLRWLKIPLGWPRVCVDAIDERLRVQTIKVGTDNGDALRIADLWDENRLDAVQSSIYVDALVFGRAFVSVGSNPTPGGLPIIKAESPLDMAVDVDVVTGQIRSALRIYGADTARRATLYLPDATIHLQRSTSTSEWSVLSVDEHRLGVVPVAQFINRQRSYQMGGSSEITPELMALTDDASRTLQSMAVAREYYSAPQRYILGATESDFLDAQGNPKSAMETYAGRILALERDASGEVPSVGQFAAHDPSVFTKVIDSYMQRVSALTGLPPHALGFSTANPTSGDAIKASDDKVMKRAQRKADMFGPAWVEVIKLALLFRDGTLPQGMGTMRTVWADTSTPTPMATAEAWTMVANAGIIPKSSSVLLDRLGLSASEQAQVEADRVTDAGENFLAQLGTDIQISQFRAAESAIKDKNSLEAPSDVTDSAA